jgi:tRNA (cmo5U34)-methyltransferase
MKNTKRFNADIGKEYDLFRLAAPHHDQFQSRVATILTQYLPLTQSVYTLFEAGIGTGITTKTILDTNENISIVGVDNEPVLLEYAYTVLQKYGNRADIQCSDILDFLKKIPDNSYDAFASVWVIHNLAPEYREKLFLEIYRVLKKGGIFVNGDKYAEDDIEAHQESLYKQIKAFDIFTTIGRPDLQTAWTEHYLEDEKIKLTEAEQVEHLDQLGFIDITVDKRFGMDAIVFARK